MRLKQILILAIVSGAVMSISGISVGQSLRDYADQRKILIGAAVEPSLLKEPAYAATLAREFNMIEAENAMKWAAIRPDRATFNFKPGDEVVAFAKQHKMKVRGHTLVWSEYNPGWLTKGRYTPSQLSDLLREHVTNVMKHYAGEVFAWDVVNEVFEADGDVETSIWYDQPGIGLKGQGTAYVEKAFHWAREADPKALLFYNEAFARLIPTSESFTGSCGNESCLMKL